MKRLLGLFTIILVVSIGALAVLTLDRDYDGMLSEIGKLDGSHKFVKNFDNLDIKELNQVDVNMKNGMVIVKGGDEFSIVLNSKHELSGEIVTYESGELNYDTEIKEVEFTIIKPDGVNPNIEIDMNIGNIEIEGANELILDLSIGNIELEGINLVKALNLGNGDLSIIDSKELEEIIYGIADLDIEVVEQERDFEIIGKIGDVSLKLNSNFDGVISSDHGLGEFTVDGISGGDKYVGSITTKIGEVSVEGVNNGK